MFIIDNNIENILMIRRGAIGDILFTLPAYYMLKANFPNSKISFLVKDVYKDVLKGFPGIDKTLILRNQVLKSKSLQNIWKMSADLFRTIKNDNYQLAVDFVGHGEQAIFLWLSGVKHRWGSTKSTSFLRHCFYTNYFVRNLDNVHIIDQHLKLLENGGLTTFPVRNEYIIPDENLAKAKSLFNNLGLSLNQPTLFIQPFTGVGVRGKMWPLDNYVRLAEYWQAQGLQILFGGSPAEREKLNHVTARFPVAAGQADFLTSVALSALSSVVVGGDTGLLHAALAAGKRTVMLFGPTNYKRLGPYKHPEWSVYAKQGDFIEDISFEQVVEATCSAIKESTTK